MLKLVGVNVVGTIDAEEPIVLTATDAAAITAADYSDPLTGANFPATVSADGQTVAIEVAKGLHNLTIGLSSPNMGTVYATLANGPLPLRYATLIGGSGNTVIPVLGQ